MPMQQDYALLPTFSRHSPPIADLSQIAKPLYRILGESQEILGLIFVNISLIFDFLHCFGISASEKQ